MKELTLKPLIFLILFISTPSLLAHSFTDAQQRDAAEKMLQNSLLFYNTALRNQQSGQYLDATSLRENAGQESNSSVAASGMGLISLALADASGVMPNARELALQTLTQLMNTSFSKRSRRGWFRHWFNAIDGHDNPGSRADGYSTIDTAILVAGAQLASRYFAASGQDQDGALQKVSDDLLKSVQWNSAIANSLLGTLYLNYDLTSEQPKGQTAKFNEYVLVACMGRLAERRTQSSGPMTTFWQQHFADPSHLPQKNFTAGGENISLLTDSPFHYLSSFTIQFAYYLCGDVHNNSGYRVFFQNAAKADRLWFRSQNAPNHYWGLGAGEALNNSYAANSIANNSDLIVSPHIMAGFMPVDSGVLADLIEVAKNENCLKKKSGYEFLWRCSLRHPEQSIERLQAIDFSTMFLGLATVHSKIGNDFYSRFSP